MSTAIGDTVFATIPVLSAAAESDVSRKISIGIGLGRVVCPEVRKKNNSHQQEKVSILE